MKFHLTRVSSNAKVGPIPTVVIGNQSCPPACQYKNNGCYAETGPLFMHWAKVTDGNRGVDFDEFLSQVKFLPHNQLWRYAVAGDLPGKGDRIHNGHLKKLVAANRGKRGFTYTHKPVTKWSNAAAIAHANQNGFTINLSSNNLRHADLLMAFGIGPVVTILPHDYGEPVEYRDPDSGKTKVVRRWKTCQTEAGHRVVQCPAEYRPEVQCANCGGSGGALCQRANRDFIVGFTVHGVQKKKATAVASRGLPILAE